MDQTRKFVPSFMLSVLAGNTSCARKQAEKPASRGQFPAEETVFFLTDEPGRRQATTGDGVAEDPEAEQG